MSKPTEMAKTRFDYANRAAKEAAAALDKKSATPADIQQSSYNQAAALAHVARGLGDLAVGVRATYILLEEIKGMLERQSSRP